MNKRAIFILAILAVVALPMTAMAAAEFTLGGYVKMEASWDSTQMNKNLTQPVMRNNDPNFHHGRLKATANSTRFNLTIKGPKLWGATTTGFIEVDFDANGNGIAPVDTGIGRGDAFRMRHAMFRLNWPETELLLGQYWGYFSSYTPETAQDSGNQFTGSPTQRLPQVRLTQKFLGAYSASMLVGAATNTAAYLGELQNLAPGESAEGPQVQAMLGFEQDLYGKAAFYGRPRGFAAQVAGGWQRIRFRPGALGQTTFSQNNFGVLPANTLQRDHQTLNAWMLQGSLFIPVIPTHSANLAGTASLSTQWNIGQGLQVFGEGQGQDLSYMVFQQQQSVLGIASFAYDRELQRRYTGFIQGQYYFTNQWFMNFVWGMSKAFGIPREQDPNAPAILGAQYRYATSGSDATRFWQQYNATLWYRPITALKFGLQYSYAKTEFFQKTTINSRITDFGEDHRVMFAGFFYF